MQMQLHALNGIDETIAALKNEAAGYRAKRDTLISEVQTLKQRLRVNENSLQNMEGDGETSSTTINSQKRVITNIKNKIANLTAEAMLLEQRAATIEGSIITLTLQAQAEQAKAAPPAPVSVAAPAPVPVTPAPVPVAPAPVRVTAPVSAPAPTVTKAGAGSFVPDVQVPEAPLPVTLPPISRLQPASIATPGAPAPETVPVTDLQKVLPWALAAGAAMLFFIQPKLKRKRRYA